MSERPEPRLRAPTDDAAESDAAAELEAEASAASRVDTLEALRGMGDVDGLIRLARAYRSGTAGVARDLSRCFDAYAAAADLGSAVASHALGLFHLHGGPVTPDDMEAAKRFRAAADGGHLAAKVIVANFYELGIHYRADPAKSDVWYRNVARAAAIEDPPDSPAFLRAMAELGCVRHALLVVERPDTTAEDRARLLRIAKIHGHREARASISPDTLADETLAALERPTAEPPAMEGRGPKARPSGATGREVDAAAEAEPAEVPAKDTRRSRATRPPTAQVGLGLTAFFFSVVCAAVALVAGHAAPPFLEERGLPVPVVGMRFELLLPLGLLVVGALPNLLVYRLSAWLRAMLLAFAAGVAGEVLWGLGQRVLPTRLIQVSDLAAAGFLAGLLVFGIFGGAKPGSR